MILAIETSGVVCSVAVCDGSGVIAARAYRHNMKLLERLTQDVQAVLDEAAVALSALDFVAADIGPGSFTGLRVGIMTAKAIANVCGKQVCGVPAPAAIAERYNGLKGWDIVPVIRARPGSVYAAVYRWQDGGMRCSAEVAMMPPADVAENLLGRGWPAGVVLCGDGLVGFGDAIAAQLRERGTNVSAGRADSPDAGMVAAVSLRLAEAGALVDAVDLVPLYVAPPPAVPKGMPSQYVE